jgi:hypothetical protein
VGIESLVATTFSISFTLSELTFILTSEVTPGVTAVYSLRSDDGTQFPEVRNVTSVSFGEYIPLSITVPSYRTLFESKKTAIIYQILVKSGNGKEVLVERRFSQFDMLHSLLYAQMPSHMASSLPPLPPKVYNPFFDQTSNDFVNERKGYLENYLNQLLGNSKVYFILHILYIFVHSEAQFWVLVLYITVIMSTCNCRLS